jgi:uncharacterized protein YjiS (DUF1127 family)
MMFIPLIGIPPIACATRTVRAVNRWLRRSFQHWRAKQRERYYFGFLNEYEVDRLARDIGLSRTELLTEQHRPTSRSLAPPLPGARSRSETGHEPRPIHLTDV